MNNKSFSNNIIVMCLTDPSCDPRPKRAAELCLSLGFNVSVMGRPLKQPLAVNSYYELPDQPGKVSSKVLRRLWCLAGNLLPFENWRVYCEKKRFGLARAKKTLEGHSFDVLTVEDLQLLPLAFEIKGQAKIIFDAREYYPRQNEGELWFDLFEKKRRIELCRKYITRCEAVITVSEGLRREYEEEFNIKATVYRSVPPYADRPAKPVEPDNIRMVYHGAANPNRRIERLIEVLSLLDERFSLDLILIGNQAYQRKIRRKAEGINRVYFPDPVSFEKIISAIGEYDIGFFYCEPATFNLENCLPNKFFEYIQARLMIAIGPSPDMAELVCKYDCGVVAEKFTVQSMAKALNCLTVEDINAYKVNSDRAAKELCFEKESQKMAEILKQLLK